jgi:hypothetical protein
MNWTKKKLTICIVGGLSVIYDIIVWIYLSNFLEYFLHFNDTLTFIIVSLVGVILVMECIISLLINKIVTHDQRDSINYDVIIAKVIFGFVALGITNNYGGKITFIILIALVVNCLSFLLCGLAVKNIFRKNN